MALRFRDEAFVTLRAAWHVRSTLLVTLHKKYLMSVGIAGLRRRGFESITCISEADRYLVAEEAEHVATQMRRVFAKDCETGCNPTVPHSARSTAFNECDKVAS